MSSNDVTITKSQAQVILRKLRPAWSSGECTAELDDAIRALDEGLSEKGDSDA